MLNSDSRPHSRFCSSRKGFACTCSKGPISQPWRNKLSYCVKWNRRNYYRAKHLSRLIINHHNDCLTLPAIVFAYFELMSNLAARDLLADRRPGDLRNYLDNPF